jgi:hypothetical protein
MTSQKFLRELQNSYKLSKKSADGIIKYTLERQGSSSSQSEDHHPLRTNVSIVSLAEDVEEEERKEEEEEGEEGNGRKR